MGPELVLIWTAGVAILVVIFGSVWHDRLTRELPVDHRPPLKSCLSAGSSVASAPLHVIRRWLWSFVAV